MLDYTLEKYATMCSAMRKSRNDVYTVASYLEKKPESNLIILRHDVDRKPLNALKMAELEHRLGISSSYYFRYVKGIFDQEIIRKIHGLGHEVGYHYEVLSKTKGDHVKAIELFEYELSEFRKICNIETICMHGSPLSKYDNRDLWKHYDFKNFGIIGEAYLSIDKQVNYFSDTGRSWNWKNKMRDFIIAKKESIVVNTTDELIELLVKDGGIDKIHILVHPHRWALNNIEWGLNYMTDLAFNVGKKVLVAVR